MRCVQREWTQWTESHYRTLNHRPWGLEPLEKAKQANKQTIGARTLLGAPGIATRSKDATRGSWPYY